MAEVFALLFGATIIIVFSHERFKRVTYEGSRRFQRLVDLLTPDKLRARRVVFRAQLFYTASLLAIYLTLCAYTELIPQLGGGALGDAIGATDVGATDVLESRASLEPGEKQLITGYAPTDGPPPEFWAKALGQSSTPVRVNEKFGEGLIPPTVSLAIALMMVGLAGSFQTLQGIDDWLRSTAHRLAGIPTWVINTADELRSKSPDLRIFKKSGLLEKDSETFWIPIGDLERMKKYREKSKRAGFPEDDDLWNDLQLIFAASAWILDSRVPLNASGQREKFAELEEAFRARKKLLTDAADGLARRSSSAAADRVDWEQVAQDADALANDLCILIALFVEHDFIVAHDPGEYSRNQAYKDATPQKAGSLRRQSISQTTLARQKLLHLTEKLRTDIDRPEQRREMVNLTMFWAAAVTILFVLFWSLLPGAWEIQLQRGEPKSAYWRLINYEFTAFSIYIVPVLVGLGVRESRWESALKWENLWDRPHWTRIAPQILAVVLLGGFAALMLVFSVVVWQAGLTNAARFDSWKDFDAILTLARQNLEYNGPMVLRGTLLAVLVLFLLDARQRAVGGEVSESGRKWRNKGASFLWALSGGIVMFCVGIGTRFLTFLARSIPQGDSERRAFDSIDAGLALYAGIFSFLLAFLVLFCVSEALFDRNASQNRGRVSDGNKGREGAASDDLPDDKDLLPEGAGNR